MGDTQAQIENRKGTTEGGMKSLVIWDIKI